MTFKGIDISNHQAGLKPATLPISFCICKATQGIAFTDRHMADWLKSLKTKKVPCGAYHFASMFDATQEAKHFYNTVKPYMPDVVPFLDYEVWDLERDHVKWCEEFIKEFKRLSGTYCGIYISASNCSRFKGSFIPEKCALWVAGYPKKYTDYPATNKVPYNVAPWRSASIWQFTDVLKLPGTSMNLDGDIAYTDLWKNKVPATSKPANSTSKPSLFQGAGRYKIMASKLNVRNGAGLDKGKVPGTSYKRGEYVNLENWSTEKDGYVWGRYKAYSGKTRYVALGTVDGKKVYLKKV